VTSRGTLAGLVARDGARRLDLDLLSPTDADRLLTRLIGDRAAADPVATAALATACARLPLALRIAAELAISHPDIPLASLVAEQHRLDRLDAGGDPYTAVRAVFSWSHRRLEPDTARTFRLLGLHPSADFDPYATAALTGTGLAQARRLLGGLSRAYLIQATAPDRYGQHDLLRDYARGLAAELDGPDECWAALTRLFDHYLHTAAAAMDTLFPAQRQGRPRVPAPASPAPPVTEQAAAKGWLDDRRDVLVEVVVYAAGHGWPGHATRLAVTLAQYLNSGRHAVECVTVLTCAGSAAQQAGDRAGEAATLLGLGNIDVHHGRYRQATEYLQQAGVMFRETGDRNGQAHTLHELATIAMMESRYDDSIRDHEQAIALFRDTADKAGEARALTNLVAISLFQGHYQRAAENAQLALVASQEAGDVICEAHLWSHYGLIERRRGRYAESNDHYRQALALFRQIGHVFGEAASLVGIGDASLGLGRPAQAVRLYRRALILFRPIDGRAGEAAARNGLGETRLAVGQPDRAYAEHAAARDLGRESGDKYEWARAEDGLGHACQALEEPGQARQHWAEALALYTDIGDPKAAEVQARLAAAEPGPGGLHGQPGGRGPDGS
jgi:tetratricopeptide (TPR) repeat protein